MNLDANMITRSESIWQPKSWQDLLSRAITDPQVLFEKLKLDPDQVPLALRENPRFTLRVPQPFVNRMRKGNPRDPLLLQVLPQQQESALVPGYVDDPLGEQQCNPTPGLIHKYHGRVLVVITGGCAIHCRYCFRQHFPYADNNPDKQQWQAIIDYIHQDPSINEVIFSGGDPLLVPDRRLRQLVQDIAEIEHVERLRIHSRLPIVIPQRITRECTAWMRETRLKTVLVLHCNHAQEIDAEVGQALQELRQNNITLLNQTVLLQGINDCPKVLGELSDRLFDEGVMPYYLHLLDHVNGAAHFDLDMPRVQRIYTDLMARLPGYLVPRLVREEAGAKYKTPAFLSA